jgi:hypothetical protein
MEVGKLLQPFVKVTWGDLDLTEFSSGGMRPQPIVYDVRISLEDTKSAPTLEMRFSPSPPAFQAFVECKTDRIDQEIVVDIGYTMGSTISFKFFYSGCSFETGHEMGISVYGVSPIKGAWTNNRISFTMVEPVPLSDFPDLIKEKCGEACSEIEFEFVGIAAEDAKEIEIKHAAIGQTPHKIITDMARANGMITSINPDGGIIIRYPYNTPEENEELKEKEQVGDPAKPKYDPKKINVYIAGPGLLNVFRREQRFNVGQTTFDFTASYAAPVAFEQDNKKIVETDTVSGESAAQIATGAATSGSPEPTVGQSGTEKTAESLKEARAAWARESTTTGSGSFFMVPYLVGIKPRDILVIPSLNANSPYFEDWIVDGVTYEQMEAGVEIGVSCKRPFPGEGVLLDKETEEAVYDVLKMMRTTKDWHGLYWSVG